MDINKVRTDIADESLDFTINRRNIKALIIKTFTGSGKTTSVLNAIDKVGLRWIYVAPFHKVIEKNVKRSPIRHFDFLHLEGKEKCCLRKDLEHLIASGVSIDGFCDKNECNFREKVCPYYINKHEAYTELPNLAVTHAHIQTFLPKFLETKFGDHQIKDFYDIMIIDENPISCFLQQKQLTISELNYIREVFILCGMKDELIQFMDCIINHDIDYDRIIALNLNQLNAIRTNKKFCKEVAILFRDEVIETVPTNIIPTIFEIVSRVETKNIEDMLFYRDKTLHMVYFVPDALDLGLRIIGLDGTANDMVWEAMLGTSNFCTFERDHTYKHVYQLCGGRYSIGIWKDNVHVQKMLCGLIDKIAARKKRGVLVLGTKWSNRTVAKLCKATNLHYATFYNLRSFNDYYKLCDTLILPIEVNPPQESLESYIALSDWSEELWRKIMREEEMLQGIGRIRQNIKYISDMNIKREDPIEIFIFPSTGVIKINSKDIAIAKSNDSISCLDDVMLLYRPTLIQEANIITMTQLRRYLDGDINLKETVSIIDRILNICPISADGIERSLNMSRSRVRKYIKYLTQRNLIEKNGNKYDVTDRGYKKLTPEKKDGRII